MSEFLSDEWCRAVSAEAADLPPDVVGPEPFTLRVEVAAAEPGAITGTAAAGYQATAEGGRLTLTPLTQAPAAPAASTVILALDLPTAVALATGTTSVADALAAGSVKVRGNATLLAQRATAVAGLGVATRRVATRTTFPHPEDHA